MGSRLMILKGLLCSCQNQVALCQLLALHPFQPMAAHCGLRDQVLSVVSVTFRFSLLLFPSLWQATVVTELVLFLPINHFLDIQRIILFLYTNTNELF